ncbi:MAG: GNAT family N-acetyltransferase [Planctomycetia bacterium]|nr:GNAT family N-acetyltransferase [Planctomycetia bacterium]
MSAEAELYYICQPTSERPVSHPVTFLSVQAFLTDEPACRALWDFIASQFRTRQKFLTIWQAVRHVAMIQDPANAMIKGMLLVSAPVNWQIDYVVVHPEARRQGIAAALVKRTLNEAYRRGVPYVMLTSRESLRPLYEGECGFTVVGKKDIVKVTTQTTTTGLLRQATGELHPGGVPLQPR